MNHGNAVKYKQYFLVVDQLTAADMKTKLLMTSHKNNYICGQSKQEEPQDSNK